MIHLVSGHPRTGTTMMMRCLNAGGLDALYGRDRDRLIHITSDDAYKLNPETLYEASAQVLEGLRFDPKQYDGRLIKMMNRNIVWLGPADYRIVFMLRDWEEVRQSHHAGLNSPPAMRSEAEYEAKMALVLGILGQRRDVQVVAFQYREVLADPLGTFEQLRDMGWPIDPVKAAAEVDPELCRFKAENLTVGIA